MTIAQLLKKHREQLNTFDRECARRRANIVQAQKRHVNARKKANSPNNPRTKESAKYSKNIYKLLLKPILNKKRKL